jgi:hypothetical protein
LAGADGKISAGFTARQIHAAWTVYERYSSSTARFAALLQPDVRQRFIDGGFDIVGGSAEAFDELLRREYAKYERTLKEAGVKPE